MRSWVSIGVVAVLCVAVVLPSSAQTDSDIDVDLPTECSPETSGALADYEIVLLMDQSGSLSRTDPDDRRVEAAANVVRTFARLSNEADALVKVAISGFGRDYYPGDFIDLTETSLPTVLSMLEEFRTRDQDLDTDYVYALQGAADQFDRPVTAETCRLLIWFTDGEHDLHYPDGPARTYDPESRPVNASNVEEIESLMIEAVCEGLASRPPIVDRLSRNQVVPVIVLLGQDLEAVPPDSRAVLSQLPTQNACGTGQGGGIISVDEAAKLFYTFSCIGHALTGARPIEALSEPGSSQRQWSPGPIGQFLERFDIELFGGGAPPS